MLRINFLNWFQGFWIWPFNLDTKHFIFGSKKSTDSLWHDLANRDM